MLSLGTSRDELVMSVQYRIESATISNMLVQLRHVETRAKDMALAKFQVVASCTGFPIAHAADPTYPNLSNVITIDLCSVGTDKEM